MSAVWYISLILHLYRFFILNPLTKSKALVDIRYRKSKLLVEMNTCLLVNSYGIIKRNKMGKSNSVLQFMYVKMDEERHKTY